MPRPKSYQTAATAGGDAADPFSSDDEKDEEAVLERLARPPPSDDDDDDDDEDEARAGTCKKTCHVKCDGIRSVPAENWYCVDCREPQCGPNCVCRTKKRRA